MRLDTRIPLEVFDRRAGALFEKLERFLGSAAIDKKLRSLDRALQIERGTFRRFWIEPQSYWWFGIRDGRAIRRSGLSFAGRVTPRMKVALETAAKINQLYSGMPDSKRHEYRQRLLNAKNLRTVLMELDIASHFVQLGCHISWLANHNKKRSPEFVVRNGELEWEIECKTKGVDAGRRVIRPAFYRLVDLVGNSLSKRHLQGLCTITVKDSMPVGEDWRKAVLEAILKAVDERKSEITLGGDERITLELRPHDHTWLTRANIEKELSNNLQHQQVAFFGPIRNHQHEDPIILKVRSAEPDRYLDDVFDDLRKASKQFSGLRPGVICCFVPEIDSFVGLEKSSALKNMTGRFFEKHAPAYVHSVVYSSDDRSDRVGTSVEEIYMPALRFENPWANVTLPEKLLSGHRAQL